MPTYLNQLNAHDKKFAFDNKTAKQVNNFLSKQERELKAIL